MTLWAIDEEEANPLINVYYDGAACIAYVCVRMCVCSACTEIACGGVNSSSTSTSTIAIGIYMPIGKHTICSIFISHFIDFSFATAAIIIIIEHRTFNLLFFCSCISLAAESANCCGVRVCGIISRIVVSLSPNYRMLGARYQYIGCFMYAFSSILCRIHCRFCTYSAFLCYISIMCVCLRMIVHLTSAFVQIIQIGLVTHVAILFLFFSLHFTLRFFVSICLFVRCCFFIRHQNL